MSLIANITEEYTNFRHNSNNISGKKKTKKKITRVVPYKLPSERRFTRFRLGWGGGEGGTKMQQTIEKIVHGFTYDNSDFDVYSQPNVVLLQYSITRTSCARLHATLAQTTNEKILTAK